MEGRYLIENNEPRNSDNEINAKKIDAIIAPYSNHIVEYLTRIIEFKNIQISDLTLTLFKGINGDRLFDRIGGELYDEKEKKEKDIKDLPLHRQSFQQFEKAIYDNNDLHHEYLRYYNHIQVSQAGIDELKRVRNIFFAPIENSDAWKTFMGALKVDEDEKKKIRNNIASKFLFTVQGTVTRQIYTLYIDHNEKDEVKIAENKAKLKECTDMLTVVNMMNNLILNEDDDIQKLIDSLAEKRDRHLGETISTGLIDYVYRKVNESNGFFNNTKKSQIEYLINGGIEKEFTVWINAIRNNINYRLLPDSEVKLYETLGQLMVNAENRTKHKINEFAPQAIALILAKEIINRVDEQANKPISNALLLAVQALIEKIYRHVVDELAKTKSDLELFSRYKKKEHAVELADKIQLLEGQFKRLTEISTMRPVQVQEEKVALGKGEESKKEDVITPVQTLPRKESSPKKPSPVKDTRPLRSRTRTKSFKDLISTNEAKPQVLEQEEKSQGDGLAENIKSVASGNKSARLRKVKRSLFLPGIIKSQEELPGIIKSQEELPGLPVGTLFNEVKNAEPVTSIKDDQVAPGQNDGAEVTFKIK